MNCYNVKVTIEVMVTAESETEAVLIAQAAVTPGEELDLRSFLWKTEVVAVSLEPEQDGPPEPEREGR